nr:MAG TPA: hypothetical protein [Bacteriophage sp.]
MLRTYSFQYLLCLFYRSICPHFITFCAKLELVKSQISSQNIDYSIHSSSKLLQY